MHLVLAHEGDAFARELVASFGPHGHLVTPRDLSREGWCHHVSGGGDDTLPISGERVPARAIASIVTRIAAVTPLDLPHIVEADREYVSAEMTSFLLAFLTSLECPVINRPSAGSLMGPSWSPPRWRAAATRAGFTVTTLGPSAGDRVFVIGDRCLGAPSDSVARAARALASIADVELLALRLTESVLLDVEPWSVLPAHAVDALVARCSAGAAS
jgi:hypothetical protein